MCTIFRLRALSQAIQPESTLSRAAKRPCRVIFLVKARLKRVQVAWLSALSGQAKANRKQKHFDSNGLSGLVSQAPPCPDIAFFTVDRSRGLNTTNDLEQTSLTAVQAGRHKHAGQADTENRTRANEPDNRTGRYTQACGTGGQRNVI